MTCIVGLIEKTGSIHIGGDSAGVGGLDIRIRKDPKVFLAHNFIYGYTSSFRMGQLLRFTFKPPQHKDRQSLRAYMYGPWIDAVRTCFKEHGYTRVDNNTEVGGRFLVGYRKTLFEVQSDFQLAEYFEPFSAVGCGDAYALGALRVLSKHEQNPRSLITQALETAEHFSGGVQRPFVIKTLAAAP